METNEKKPLSRLYEEMKRIRNLPLDPKAVEEFNELRSKDEELEIQKQDQHPPASLSNCLMPNERRRNRNGRNSCGW